MTTSKKTFRENAINTSIPSFTTSAAWRVPVGYCVKMVSVASSSAGAVATIKKGATTLGTVTLTDANVRYEFSYDYSYLEAGSWVLNIEVSAGTCSAYVESATEKPARRTSGVTASYALTANQFAAIGASSSPTAANMYITKSAIPAGIAATNFKALTPSSTAYTTAGTGARNAPFINIGSWDSAMSVTLAGDHWVPIQVNLSSLGNAGFDVAAARLRVDTGATNALNAIGCLQLRQNLGHNIASSAIINASVNVSATVTVGTGSLLGGYFSIEGSGRIIKAGANDCTPLVAVNNNTNASGTVDNVFKALQNGTGTTVAEVISVDVTNGTATAGINVENSGGTLTTGVLVSGATTNAVYITGNCDRAINIGTGTIVAGIVIGNVTTGIAISGSATTAVSLSGTGTTALSISGTYNKGIDFTSATPVYEAYSTAGTGGRNNPFIKIGSWDDPLNVTLASDHWVPIQVNVKNSGNVAFDVAAARLRVDTGATNATAAVGCLQLRQNLAHAVASSAILNASVNVSAGVTVGTGSLLGGYFSIEGSGQITKAGGNDCTVLVAVNNNTNASGTVDNVFKALQNGTGSTVAEVVSVDVTNGTATAAIHIENSGGTLTNGIKFSNTIATGVNFAGTLTKGIDFSSATMAQGTSNFVLGYGDIGAAKSITPTDSIVPVQVNVLSIADSGTSGDQTIGAAYFKTANSTAHQPNHQLATLMARATVAKNIWDAYALQSHLTLSDDISTTAANAHLTAISGKTVLTASKTVAAGWVTAGLFIIDGAAGAAVTQMCHGVSIVSEVGVPNSVVQSMLHLDVGATVNAAIQVNGVANVTNLFDFNAQAGCLSADTGSPAGTTIAKIQIDMNGTPGFIPVYADY